MSAHVVQLEHMGRVGGFLVQLIITTTYVAVTDWYSSNFKGRMLRDPGRWCEQGLVYYHWWNYDDFDLAFPP